MNVGWNINRKSVERRLLHLVGALIANCQDGDTVSGGQEFLRKVEANDCMTTAIGVYDEHILLLCLDDQSKKQR